MRNEFDPDKAREALVYIAQALATDIYISLKLIYLADKEHLSRYGSQIFGDSYAALEFGPVPSGAYDAVKVARGDQHASTRVRNVREALRVEPPHYLIALRDPDLRYLSETDVECLNDSIEKYGHLTFDELRRLTHDQAYEATQRNHHIELDAIAATLSNGPEVIQHLADPCPSE